MLGGFLHSTIMITKDLIKELQKLVDKHGDNHQIMLDVFVRTQNGYFKYMGFCPPTNVVRSANDNYDIISTFPKVK